MLESLTFDQMKAFVGTTFHTTAGDREIDLLLVQAGKVMESEAAQLDRNPFSLFFLGPGDLYLPQKMYTLRHETLGTLEIFIAPVGRDAKGYLYEAVFT